MISRRMAAFALGLALASVGGTGRAMAVQPGTVRPESDENLQWSAGVVSLTPLHRQRALDGKLFGTAGGDPAMNGLYTYLAFYVSVQDGWRVFRIGDFLDYRLVSETPGRLLLAVHESVMRANGEIGARDRRITVTFTPGPHGAPPDSVRVQAAR